VNGHVFITPGTITEFRAHAFAFSASNSLSNGGSLYSAFKTQVPGFEGWYAELRAQQAGRTLPVGSSFWMPLPGKGPPHGVVVVVSTGGERTTEDKAGIAVRAALTTAVEELRRQGCTGRLLIALPAFRVGRGGDRQQRLRSARVQVAAASEVLADLPQVDAVFVTYTPTLYQIFLEARRQALGPAPADTPHFQVLEDALRARECVLFVGAGLSRGTGLPDWSQLIDRLSADLHIRKGERVEYLDLAQWYRERFGAAALAEVIRATFGDPSCGALPTLAHYLLLSLPVRHIITTNYDDLLERTLTALKRHPTRIVRQQDVTRTGQGHGVCVVKMHGDAATPEEVVLCRDDYDGFFERRPAIALLLEGLLLNQTFFFVGYSLRDPNFRQIFVRIARMLREARRPAFATTFEAAGDSGGYLTEQWRNKQLHLIGIPGSTQEEQEQQLVRFLDALAERVTLQTPRLFLAPEQVVSPPLERLRNLLLDEVGAEVEAVVQRKLTGPNADVEVRYLAEVLAFLTHNGWRPSQWLGEHLCKLWENLAEQTADPAERRRLLIAALDCTETFTDLQRVRTKLQELERTT
jgi:hypothetical protein